MSHTKPGAAQIEREIAARLRQAADDLDNSRGIYAISLTLDADGKIISADVLHSVDGSALEAHMTLPAES